MALNVSAKIIISLIAAITLTGGFIIFNKPESTKNIQSTDDAYVRTDMTVVIPQVSGIITHLAVTDNQHVKAGALLLRIDDRELQIRVANSKAEINSLNARLALQQSLILQANATVKASEAGLKLAERNRRRFANLATDGSGTLQAAQQAEKEWETQRASLTGDRAGLRAAEQQVAILRADLEKAQAEKDEAELNLSYAKVTAPVSGIVSQRHARSGAYVRSGEPLMTVVPLDKIYIEANFRETQLSNMQVGQPVDMTFDALPGVKLQGHVESLGPASGSSFSLIPPHNATGNFTKITQRLPVRIKIDKGQHDAQRLRVGMSVTPVIHTALLTAH